MVRGKSIQIYLPDGNPKGIKVCEIPNSVIKAVFIPRNLLDKVSEFENIEKVGIYFLFSEKDELSRFQTYIGEAEEIRKRLKQHDTSEKDYWNFAVCFMSEKNNLNKAHIKFLESYCHEEAKNSNRTELKNSCSPQKSTLSKPEEDFALNFYDEMKLILGTLGYPIFEKIKRTESKEEVFFCKNKSAFAIGNLTEEGFLVYKDSIANKGERPSANKFVTEKRRALISEGILKQEKDTLIFTRDYIFNSPSLAASVVAGGNANGWKEWKNESGLTLDELKRNSKKESEK